MLILQAALVRYVSISGNINILYCHSLDREPDVSINVALDQRNAYTFDGESTYQVGYGHEFGLECRTSSFFKAQWQLNNQPCKSDIVCSYKKLIISDIPVQ